MTDGWGDNQNKGVAEITDIKTQSSTKQTV